MSPIILPTAITSSAPLSATLLLLLLRLLGILADVNLQVAEPERQIVDAVLKQGRNSVVSGDELLASSSCMAGAYIMVAFYRIVR